MVHELLVHISAPTTRQTDELYHSLAGAYLEFEPHRAHADESRQDVPARPSAASRLNAQTSPNQEDPVATSFLSTSKDSYGSFPSHISSDGHSKVRVGARNQFYYGAGEEDIGQTSTRLDQLDRIHQNRKKQTTPMSSFNGGKSAKFYISSSPDDANTAFIEDTQEAARQLQSQLSDSYSTTSVDTSEDDSKKEITQENPSSPVGPSQRNIKNTPKVLVPETPKYGSIVSNSRESLHLRGDDNVAESPIDIPSKSPIRSGSTIPNTLESLRPTEALHSSTSSPKTKDSGNKSENTNKAFVKPIDFSKLCIDAYPPEPKVSIACPGSLPSQVTKALRALKKEHPKRFRPLKQRGTPKADDRGFWFIDCAHWSLHHQQEFWNHMCDQIASGRLGWGVTLYREGGTSQSLGRVKLYCWGEVVEHMWLVLWLFSRANVIGSKLKWFDADGNAIFEMA
ncbi:hypothetical protein CFE70_001029 [Pyrenophora teres f. teres 0-1]|uniref:Uncharacterized protein n=2 Tax=Pyrenophora teres f. teres TaxID=97479 RepID=E3RLA3_PYRTT|nr:hypothetical protein PTT_09129 [Pyrenophora teres f. teres 0-1]KAE8822856.1 hypothetical protein HRS9139_10196 [Pyrenophora teres f. teres]KAE8826016.1 hypothetical protein PTNB85_08961 [Pyrenophora teres f. teres]KAE8832975.1 hypothetical protein HRS9122_08688 [Pyrenophora teres f. teres]KAE8852925.1 hypothetical protein PTNB29_10315 [Pyrenophora teres f. teres]